MQLPHQLQMRAVFVILLAVLFAANQIGANQLHRGRIHDGESTKLLSLAAGSILTHVGNGFYGHSGDGGPALSAKIQFPQGIAIDPSTGDLYISDDNVIRMVAKSTGIITTVAGNGSTGYNGDGMLATSSKLSYPLNIAIDPITGDLYIADTDYYIVRLVTKSTGLISTIAGTGILGYSGDGGLATNATLSPTRLAVDPRTRDLYITDTRNHVIRMIAKSTGIITTIAGTGQYRYSGDGGPATSASLYSPSGIAIAAVTGDVYIADTYSNAIRMISKSIGIITTIAGTRTQGYSGNGGPATSAKLNRPSDVAIDAVTGNIYICDTGNNVIRMIAKSTGIITTVAGTRRAGYTGDGGPATLAMLDYPQSVAIDASSGMMYIADQDNNVVRSVILTLDVTSRPSAIPVARPPTAVTRIPTAAPSSAGTRLLGVGSILTYVGNGLYGYSGDGGPATLAEMGYPRGMAIDPSTGDLYVSGDNVIRMVAKSTGIITTVAGNGSTGYNGDGMLATSSRLNEPTDVAIDPITGDLYIADTDNYIVRLVTKSTGLISTIAGTGILGYSGDGGLATNATLSPTRLAVDPRTRDLYITDSRNHVIRMIAKSTGIITTIAGMGKYGYSGDGGPATSASLYSPSGIAIAAVTGDVYIADTYNNAIRMISKSIGIITTIAGTRTQGYSGNGGPATSAKLNRPSSVAIDAVTGNIYICDTGNNVIRMIAKSTGIITTVAGTRRRGYTGDGGPAVLAMLSDPYSIVIDASSGMMYIADTDNNIIRSVILTLDVTSRPSAIPVARPPTAVTRIPTAAPSSAGTRLLDVGSILTYVGNGLYGYSGDGGPATLAEMGYPRGVAIDPSTGDLYVSADNVIRMVAKSTGIITTVAGNGLHGYNGDGMLATSSRLNDPTDVAIDPITGDLYIADTDNYIVRLVTKSTGLISTIAGTGILGYSGDGGLATNATLSPTRLAVDPHTRNLYITDTRNHVIRMIAKSTGIITTIAGMGKYGYSGDGGPATSASLYSPSGIAIAAVTGDVYIADTYNNAIRMISKSIGIITTIAGTRTQGYSGNGGPATSAKLNRPSSVAIDAVTGNIYICDTGNNVIRMIAKSTGIITTVAGTRRAGYTGDWGPATLAMLDYPQSVATDASSGMMYIADTDNNIIRSVILTLDVTSRPSVIPVSRPPTAPPTMAPTSTATPVSSRAPSVAVSSIPTAAAPSSADLGASATSDSNKGQQSGFSKIVIFAIIAVIASGNWFY